MKRPLCPRRFRFPESMRVSMPATKMFLDQPRRDEKGKCPRAI